MNIHMDTPHKNGTEKSPNHGHDKMKYSDQRCQSKNYFFRKFQSSYRQSQTESIHRQRNCNRDNKQ